MSLEQRIHDYFRLGPDSMAVDVHHLPHAVEDIPEDGQEEAATVFHTRAGEAFQQRAFDVLENAVGAAYGHAECEDLFRFLSQYSVTDYTYDISESEARGSRPDASKVTRLFKAGFGALYNLCAETPDGDAKYIEQAGLKGNMEPFHADIVDAMPPTFEVMAQILTDLAGLRRDKIRVFIHCEAGKGRTGVVVACIRMAFEGWSAEDAIAEARNFGMWTPDQEEFIRTFEGCLIKQVDAREAQADAPFPELGDFPLKRPGSEVPSAEQKAMTLAKATKGNGVALG